MANVKYSITEFRAVIAPEITHVYVALRIDGDSEHMLGIDGWHYKAFPASTPLDAIIDEAFAKGDDPVLWPLKAPG